MSTNKQAVAASRGFISFHVLEKRQESATITSFVLAAADDRSIASFRPGQFIVVRVPSGPEGCFVQRNYSLSGCADHPEWLRISVKREPAPAGQPELPDGLVSSYLHDQVKVGDLLDIAGPAGEFVLDEDSARPVILFSGGVGLTPMVSMLHQLCRHSTRRVYFIHACENGAVHAFRDEVMTLAAQRPGIVVHFCYRNPGKEDLTWGACDSQGLITRETLQTLLPLDDYDCYLCGPRPFMQANWRLLRSLGVAKHRIHYEFFGPATILDEDETAVLSNEPTVPSPAPESNSREARGLTVSFLPSGTRVAWDPSCHSLLELAEQAGLAPPFNCRTGLCNSCLVRLREGSIEYFEAPLDPPADGHVLLCCARPTTAVTVELCNNRPR